MIVQRMLESSTKASKWLEKHLTDEGSYKIASNDLACYYKAPLFFMSLGKNQQAHALLDFIQKQFMQSNGDFKTSESCKSSQAALTAYWPYMNGWITLAAQRLGRFDISYPAYQYLSSFYSPRLGGGMPQFPPTNLGEIDALMTAHLGLLSLYFGDIQRATAAGNALIRLLALQPDKKKGFYLRLKEQSKLVQEYPLDQSLFYYVSAIDSNQAYFMIGYPIAFLGKLYQATYNQAYLQAAEGYVEFALNCQGNIDCFPYSHKTAWGASLIAMLTKHKHYQDLADRIAHALMEMQQPDGCWFPEDAIETTFDQTTEIAIWLTEMCTQRYSPTLKTSCHSYNCALAHSV